MATTGKDENGAYQQNDKRTCAEPALRFGNELPDIEAEEFSLLFDYSDDGASYLVLYGNNVVLSGLAADDSDDYITDIPMGEQFIEIASTLKKRYGVRLVDLVPTARAADRLTDFWGWSLKLQRGRELVQRS
jgi:hypothetical protein